MNNNNEPDDRKMFEDTAESTFDYEDYASETGGTMNQFTRKKSRVEMPFILMGAAIVVLIVIFIIIFSPGKSSERKLITELDSRVLFLEGRVSELQTIDEKLAEFEKRINEQIMAADKSSGAEEALSERIDQLTGLLGILEKKIAAVRRGAPVTAATVSPQPSVAVNADSKFHIVKAGENLFRISQKYNLKMDELLKLNNFKEGATIYQGQKILIKP